MYPRLIRERIDTALSDTRVVLVTGPRQAGKTTLVQQMASKNRPFFTLDSATTLEAVQNDPVGFVRGLDRAVIDEVQRVPERLLAIKESVESDQRPGRFLLTGSANLMTVPRIADSLAGRMEVIRLLPLAQTELHGSHSTFLDRVFDGEAPDVEKVTVAEDLTDADLAGGYPEAVARKSHTRRQAWYLNYIDAIVQRDISDIARIEHSLQMPQLLRALALHSGQLVNYSKVGSSLGMNHVTTRRYTGILEQLFLIHTLPPWCTNRLKRLVKTPKLHFLDSGLLAALQGIAPERLREERRLFGPLLETFVFAELLKLASGHVQHFECSHFRDKQQNEVDIIMQNRSGHIAGIEVKASATVTKADFAGLRRLAQAHQKQFVLGLVLYDHDKVVPFGDRLLAAPISTLW